MAARGRIAWSDQSVMSPTTSFAFVSHNTEVEVDTDKYVLPNS